MTMGKGEGIGGSTALLPLCKQGTWLRRCEMDTNMESMGLQAPQDKLCI
jgi:hypothetical protein